MTDDQSQPLRFNTMAEMVQWCGQAPAATRVAARVVGQEIGRLMEDDDPRPGEKISATNASDVLTWREKLWIVPAETRLGIQELTEALDRPKSFIYKRTASGDLPHRKHQGALVFLVGEIRTWIRETEDVEASAPMMSTKAERNLTAP